MQIRAKTCRLPVLGLLLAVMPVASGAVVMVRTDLRVAQAAAPGPASCRTTTAAENAAAARATSALRAARGLGSVRPNARLAAAAARHACEMAGRGLMTHAGLTTRGPGQRVEAAGYRSALTAENIAAGPFGLGEVLGAWNQSQGHRANILIPQIADYGIGQAVGADGRTVFWTALYAAPLQR